MLKCTFVDTNVHFKENDVVLSSGVTTFARWMHVFAIVSYLKDSLVWPSIVSLLEAFTYKRQRIKYRQRQRQRQTEL